MSTYNNSFSNFGRPPVPDDSCKDSAPRHPQFWRRRFLKVFTVYGHGGHLGQPTATILAIFCSATLRRLQTEFEQNWLSCFRGEVSDGSMIERTRKSIDFSTFQALELNPKFRLIEIRKVLNIAEVTFTFVFRDTMMQFETRVMYRLFFALPAKFYHSDDKNNK